MFERMKIRFSGLVTMLVVALASVQSFAQTAALEIPAGTEDKLIGYVNSAFPVVIGVVIAIVGVGVIIKMIKRAG